MKAFMGIVVSGDEITCPEDAKVKVPLKCPGSKGWPVKMPLGQTQGDPDEVRKALHTAVDAAMDDWLGEVKKQEEALAAAEKEAKKELEGE